MILLDYHLGILLELMLVTEYLWMVSSWEKLMDDLLETPYFV